MRVLKLFLGKYIFLQIFLKFQIFNVKRLDGILLRPNGCSLDSRAVKWQVRTPVVLSKDDMVTRVRTG
jgi:hypothetical protein